VKNQWVGSNRQGGGRGLVTRKGDKGVIEMGKRGKGVEEKKGTALRSCSQCKQIGKKGRRKKKKKHLRKGKQEERAVLNRK